MSKIKVQEKEITIVRNNEQDYISLTDMVRNLENNNIIISNWLRRKDTLEFLGYWEKLYNPFFKLIEFDEFMNKAGTNRFAISPKQWIEGTNATSLISKSGRYGGTYAHKDIAFEFGAWLSPLFKLLLIKEFQRLKDEEQKRLSSEWDFRRLLSKANYKIHTDSIKENLIPLKNIPKEKELFIYADEAELLNFAMFGITSKEWRLQNPKLDLQGLNIRDAADAHELIVLSNIESLNAELIRKNVSQKLRLMRLRDVVIAQLKSLRSSNYTLDKIESPYKAGDTTLNIPLDAHPSDNGKQ